MAVQRLRLCASTAGGTGSIPGWGTKSLHALLQGREKKKKKKKTKEEKKRKGGICCPPTFFLTLNGRWPRTDSSGLLFLNTCSHSDPSQYLSSSGPPHWSPCPCSLMGRPINSCHMSTDSVTPLLKAIIDQRHIHIFLESELTHVNTINITRQSY